MKYVIGDVVSKDSNYWVLLGVFEDYYIIQNIYTYERQQVPETWFNDCKLKETTAIILRTPYLCAKYYSNLLLDFYKKYKKEIKGNKIDYDFHFSCFYESVLSDGLRFCVYSEDSEKYIKYKEKLKRELNKALEKFKKSKNI